MIPHDILEIKGSTAPWKNVVALYAVKTNTSDVEAQEVATMTPEKAKLLSDVFWDVNSIDTSTEEVKETKTVTSTDEFGNVTEKEVTITKIKLIVQIDYKSLGEVVNEYDFDDRQKETLNELLKSGNDPLWNQLLG